MAPRARPIPSTSQKAVPPVATTVSSGTEQVSVELQQLWTSIRPFLSLSGGSISFVDTTAAELILNAAVFLVCLFAFLFNFLAKHFARNPMSRRFLSIVQTRLKLATVFVCGSWLHGLRLRTWRMSTLPGRSSCPGILPRLSVQ